MSRVMCAVPHCGRSTEAPEHAEWLCQDHWKLARRRVRAALRRAQKRGRDGAASMLWGRIKAEAIEVAAGIA